MDCLRKFEYNSRGQVSLREVYVLNVDESYVHGLDFVLLSEEERNDILEKLKDHSIGRIKEKKENAEKIENYNPVWNKAFRCFKRTSIVNNGKYDLELNIIEKENECQN